MSCPHCLSTSTSKRKNRTGLGYRIFFCPSCGKNVQYLIFQLETFQGVRSLEKLVKLVRTEQRALRKESHARVGTLTKALTDVERRLAQNYEALESGSVSIDDLAPRIRQLREEQKKLVASIRGSKSPNAEANNAPSVDDIIHALENFGDVMATGSQGERKEFIRGLVTQIVKSEDKALIRYRLPDGKSARQNEVLDIDPIGGAKETAGGTELDSFELF